MSWLTSGMLFDTAVRSEELSDVSVLILGLLPTLGRGFIEVSSATGPWVVWAGSSYLAGINWLSGWWE